MPTKILVSDPLDEEGLTILKNSGFPVDLKPGLSEEELCEIIDEYDCLIIRSGTKVTAKVIEAAKNLRVIGRAGVGVDNIDVPAATEKGILVMNTPSANILSAAEHSCAMLMAMARNIPFAHESMHKGEWKRSKYTGVELNGKVLGVIGVGRVGGEVVKRMKAFNMTVIGYDPFLPQDVADSLGVRLTTLEEVISNADFMTIHTPLLPETRNMISMPQFKMMKPNAMIANVARGGIVNEDDLYVALKENIIAAAAFDVWCSEPLCEAEQKLMELDNLVTTPHLGASTYEAQLRVAVEVAEHAVMYLKDGIITNAINAPRGKLDADTEAFEPLAKRMGTLVQQMVGNNPLDKMEVVYLGGLASRQNKLLTVSAAIGYLRNIIGEANMINALPVCKSKGIDIVESTSNVAIDYANAIEIRFTASGRTRSICGTVIGGQPRLVGIDAFTFDIPFKGDLIYMAYTDAPGVIGIVGNILGEAGVNIGQMSVGRDCNNALMVLTVDHPVSESIVSSISKAVGTDDLKYVEIKE